MKPRLFSIVLRMRNRHLFALDALILCMTPALALLLRIEKIDLLAPYYYPLLAFTGVSLLWKLFIFHRFGLYFRYWQLASTDDIALLALSTIVSWFVGMVVYYGGIIPLHLIPAGLPRSVPIIDGLLTMLAVGGSRLMLRLSFEFNERIRKSKYRGTPNRVLIAGAGVAGSIILKEMRTNPAVGMTPIGFVDDDPNKRGIFIQGIPVLGSLDDIQKCVSLYSIDEVIIAMPAAPGLLIRSIVHACTEVGVKHRTLPGIFEILAGPAITQLRNVHIGDLLRRGMVKTDITNVQSAIKGATIMVTGAGGSIGTELCRQICAFSPSELILIGHGENSIFEIAKELGRTYGVNGKKILIDTVIADIRDRDRMEQVFRNNHPDIIFHAAAHKHVGLMESNIPDAVTNNVLGTKILTDLAGLYKVDRLVMISSDKAVHPTSIMGVTKRVAELIVRDAGERWQKSYVTVRFGNVLGSRGSVVPIFQEQIARGGPVTITHPEMERFFMTIPEAVELVLQAGTMGSSGEIFVLDMGKQVKVVDLARDLIRLNGLREGEDIEIKFTGLVHGEKLSEELFYEFEKIEKSKHEKILVHKHPLNGGFLNPHSGAVGPTVQSLKHDVDNLIIAAQEGSIGSILFLLEKIVPEFHLGKYSPPMAVDNLNTFQPIIEHAINEY